MLNEGDAIPDFVPVLPEDLKEQIPWKTAKGVAVLVLNDVGQENQLFMSSLTIEQLTFLSKQLDSHLTCMMGQMKEGF